MSSKKYIKLLLKFFNIRLIREDRYLKLDNLARQGFIAPIIGILNNPNKSELLTSLPKTKSQIGQDLFVLSETNFKKNGFFVEFGAADGFWLSNTYILEKEYMWQGILAEPARVWHSSLEENRICHIEHECVWSETGHQLKFSESDLPEYSTISKFKDFGLLSGLREGRSYNVKTISLEDMLDKYDAPKFIDYLSMDTEGSELDILKNFNFDKYTFGLITCEHGFSKNRQAIFDLLASKGYVRKYESISKVDDWFIHESQSKNISIT